MEPKVNFYIVITFVMTLTTAIFITAIWLSFGLALEKYSTYMVYMTESVTGLEVNSNVEFNGVEVGQVDNIELDPTNPHFVQILLKIKSTTPVTQGTVATLASRGLTNITHIALKDSGNDIRPIQKTRGQEYPVIKSGPSLFTRLDIALGRLVANFRRVKASLENLLDKENLQAARHTLLNLDQITDMVKASNEQLNIIVANTTKASHQLRPFMQSSTNAVQLLQIQTLPMAYRVMANLNNLSRVANELAVDLQQNPSLFIRDTQQSSGPGEAK